MDSNATDAPAASFDVKRGPPLGCGVAQSVPWFSRGNEVLRPKMANGGIFSTDFEEGSFTFAPPTHFGARKAVELKAPSIPMRRMPARLPLM